MNSSIPWAEYIFMMCQSIGLPPISTMGFGRTVVSSARRVPRPPARITAFIGAESSTSTVGRLMSDLSNASAPTYDVAVVGLGRVGLPLALTFAGRGLRVIGVDKDADRLASLREGRMPFDEPGAQELLDRVELALTDRVGDAAQAEHIVITIGTPALSHIEIDLRDIRSALDDLLPVLREGSSLVLRSTVAPGTTEFVAGYLAKHRGFTPGEDVYVAHAPERIAAGKFLEEIDTLPCIIGGIGGGAGARGGAAFGCFDAPIVQTTPVQAELA